MLLGAEQILAVGGGSAIDTAKGDCDLGAANPGTDIWEVLERIKKRIKDGILR